MKVKLNLFKKLRLYWLKKSESRYYNSIEDLPLLNWWKLHETKDFKWLLNREKRKIKFVIHIIPTIIDVVVRIGDEIEEKYRHLIAPNKFKRIKNDFTNEFGIDEKYSDYLDKVVDLTLLEIEISKSGNTALKNFVNILEIEIEDLFTEDERQTRNDHGLSIVSKYIGESIKIKEISVYEFYNHIDSIKREIKNYNGIR